VSGEIIECPLCGYRFKPEKHAACTTCPLAGACSLVCCPACGYSTVNPARSKLAQFWTSLRRRKTLEKESGMTLTDVFPGARVRIAGFSGDLSSHQQEHLQAYGLVAGRKVRVLQHSPVTVVQVEHLELAMEAELAGKVRVDQGNISEQNEKK
jgi:Fe2+ transport system protein FeoA